MNRSSVNLTAAQNMRRFPRIYLQSNNQPLTTLLGARAVWPNGDRLDIQDLSYTGVALVRSPRMQCEMGEKLQITFALAGQKEFIVVSEVARITDKIVALLFGSLTTEARVGLERYLQEKMIGLHVRSVDAKYFARPGSATHWFHGPNNTNVFLWYENQELKQATVELGADFLRFENAEFSEGAADQFIDKADEDYVKPLLESVSSPVASGLTTLMARILDVLSQVEDPHQTLQPLLQAILARQK